MKSFVPILIALALLVLMVAVLIFLEPHWREWKKGADFRRERRRVRQRRKHELKMGGGIENRRVS